MTFVRVLAAFLFAIVLVVGAYASFWLLALRHAEAGLAENLAGHFGATIEYGPPQWQPDPSQVDVILPNVTLTINPAGTQDKIVLKAATLELVSSFFDHKQRLQVLLPKTMQAVWHMADGRVLNYNIMSERGELIFLQKQGQDSVMLRMPTGRVDIAGGKELITFTDGYVGWLPSSVGEMSGGRRVELGMKNVSSLAGDWEDLVVRADMLPAPALAQDVVGVLRNLNKASVDSILRKMVQWVRVGGRINIDHAVIKTANYETALFGNLKIDTEGLPNGQLTVTSNNSSWLADTIKASGLLRNGSVEEMFRRSQVLDKIVLQGKNGADATAQMVIHQGQVIMNTQRVGPVNKYEDMIKNW